METQPEKLKRELRLIDVIALGLNGVIGTGIFLIPGEVDSVLGPASVVAYLVSAVLCTLLVLCFAEVGSRFRGTGGPLIYSQAAFGDLVGCLVGWVTWVVRITAWAAIANGLVTATEVLVPGAVQSRVPILVGLFVVLSMINIAGVSQGAKTTNLFTAAKLVPIAVFLLIGVFHIDTSNFTPFAPKGMGDLASGTMLILWAFVGFEVLTVPAGEMRDPQRSTPRALVIVMAVVTVVYLGVWAVCTGTLETLAGSANPVADAAAAFLGPVGGKLVAAGIVLSVLGISAGSAMVAPRILYALAHEGYLPRFLAWVHPTRRTPVPAIVISSTIACILALSGSYVELAVMSVVARFAQYIPTCMAVSVLRRRSNVASATFRIPFGAVIPAISIAICIWLLAESEPRQLAWGLAGLLSGLVFYLPIRFISSRR